METNEQLENILLELRRGVITLAVLSQLNEEQYGYSLIKRLDDLGLQIDQGTLYPLLRRLETQHLLQSAWRVETGRPRRYYMLSAAGIQLLPRLKEEWNNISAILQRMLNENEGNEK
jgi:PadR family transcriptional regulator PadR